MRKKEVVNGEARELLYVQSHAPRMGAGQRDEDAAAAKTDSSLSAFSLSLASTFLVHPFSSSPGAATAREEIHQFPQMKIIISHKIIDKYSVQFVFQKNNFVESPSVGHTKAAREDCSSSSSSASSLGGKKKKVGPASASV